MLRKVELLNAEYQANYKRAYLSENPNNLLIVTEVIQKAKILANGDIPLMKEVAVDLENRASQNQIFPYHQLFYSLFNYFSGNLNKAEADLKLLTQISWPSSEVQGYVEIIRGSNLRSLGALDLAIVSLNKSLELLKPKGELEVFRGFSHYHLGGIEVVFEDYEKAEIHFMASLVSAEFTQQKTALFRSCMGLADLYLRTNKIEQGSQFLDQASILADNTSSKAVVLIQKATYYLRSGAYEKALLHINSCIKFRKRANLDDALNTALVIKAEILTGLGEFQSAIDVGTKVLSKIKKYETRVKERDCLNVLMKAYKNIGDYQSAFTYLEEFEKLNKEIIQDQYKEILKHKNQFITQQKNELFYQNQAIKSSINYSKNLQTAILPSTEILNSCLPNHFILYLPKDIVAGDFYWVSCPEMREENNLEKDWVLFASADCTGHGVPGAIVSFICSDLLNRAVSEFKLIDPARILDKVTELIIKRFGMNDNMITDGMDISLAAYNQVTGELRWAGANNCLIMVSDNKLIDIKGDRQGIGYTKDVHPFTTHSIQIKKNDVMYLGTDGYPDQFGGKRGKKLSKRKYKDKLLEYHSLSMNEQKKQLRHFIESWSANEEQLDDICLFGVRF